MAILYRSQKGYCAMKLPPKRKGPQPSGDGKNNVAMAIFWGIVELVQLGAMITYGDIKYDRGKRDGKHEAENDIGR